MNKPSISRIQVVLDALHTTPNAFAKTHSLNVGTMYGFANGTRSPGFEMLERICKVEPRISAEFLLRGKGKPLLDLAESLTTVEQLQAFRTEVNQILDRRIQEMGQFQPSA